MSSDFSQRSAAGGGERAAQWAAGLSLFAGAVMVVMGVLHVFTGIAGIVNDTLLVATPNFVYAFNLTAWGWIHLLLGIVILAAGFGVIRGQTWARAVGVVLAGLSVVANFLFLPYYPLWSLVIIALDVAVIWALVSYREELV